MNQPISLSERIDLIDIIRGFALIGVIIINLQTINMPPFGSLMLYEPMSTGNRVTELLLRVFIEGKFYTIFSILFGLGFSIQIARLKERTESFISIYLRRLFVLLIIGFAHAIFIWDGDILRLYALIGFLLLLFHTADDRKHWRWIIILFTTLYLILMSVYVVQGIKSLSSTAEEKIEHKEESLKELNEEMQPFLSYNYGDICIARTKLIFSADGAGLIFLGLFDILPLFLIGAILGRKRIFNDLEANRPILLRIFKWSLIAGLLFSGLFIYGFLNSEAGIKSIPRSIMLLSENFSNPILALLYVSGISLIFSRKRYQKILMPLSYVGRMALTNYLTQSVVLTLVFYNYGLGFMGQKDLWLLLLISIGFYCLQVVFSWLWLKMFRFGPMEWLWRSFTYGKIQPIMKEKLST